MSETNAQNKKSNALVGLFLLLTLAIIGYLTYTKYVLPAKAKRLHAEKNYAVNVAKSYYNAALASGDRKSICTNSRYVAASYREANDEFGYDAWKTNEEAADCANVHTP